MKRKAKSAAREAGNGNASVCFEMIQPAAQSVFIAGSFNDWHPAATPMIALGEGRWRKELTLLPGRYEYRLVVDGQWVDDPAARETVPNPVQSSRREVSRLESNSTAGNQCRKPASTNSPPKPLLQAFQTIGASGRVRAGVNT